MRKINQLNRHIVKLEKIHLEWRNPSPHLLHFGLNTYSGDHLLQPGQITQTRPCRSFVFIATYRKALGPQLHPSSILPTSAARPPEKAKQAQGNAFGQITHRQGTAPPVSTFLLDSFCLSPDADGLRQEAQTTKQARLAIGSAGTLRPVSPMPY